MTKNEKLKLFKDKYEKDFDQALNKKDRNKAHQIIKSWQDEYANQSNNQD